MDLLNIKPNVVSRSVAGKYFLFYGDPSTRKTSVAAKFPGSLILATEIGYSMIPGVHAINIPNWAEFRNVIRELKRPEVKSKYQTIVIDTVGLLTDMCMKFILETNNVNELGDIPWGQGWNKFKKEFRTQMSAIAQLGYGIVFIAHSDTKRDNETGHITAATPTMDKKPRESVIALVDFILFVQKEAKDNNPDETTVYAYSKLPSQIESKTRARYLAPRFEFTFENLEKEIVKAIDMLEQEEGAEVSSQVINHHVEVAEAVNLSFDALKEQTLLIAKELLGLNDDKTVAATAAIGSIMKGVRVSEATALHYDQLVALRETLIDIKEGA